MSTPELVDWALAERVAAAIAGSSNGAARPDPAVRPFGPDAVAAACEGAAVKVRDYTGLGGGATPPGEAIDRGEWARAGIGNLRDLAAGLELRLAEGLSLPGPLGGIMRSIAGRAAGAEAGAAVGLASRRVLGQYEISLGAGEREPRLLLVEPNLEGTHAQLGGAAAAFLEWVALHETTHALQFGGVEWLRQHISELLAGLIEASAAGLDGARLRELARRLVTSDPRKTVRSLLRGELARALAGPEQAEALDRLQAVMAVVEGYAEHVMDRAAPERAPEFAQLRRKLDERRESRGGLGEAIARLLGMELKMQQYRLGKAFSDAVVDEGGIDALNQVWAAPDALPSLDELEAPHAWLERLSVAAA